jgi:RimJ/RimL family protein N-acetyltransferase
VKNAFRTGQRICFRPLEIEHGPLFQAWVNDPENHQFLRRSRPLNGAEEKQWLEKAHERKEEHSFEIALQEPERLIGICSLRVELHRSADLGILIGEREFQGKGYGAEALALLLEYGFATLGLHRIGLSVYENNARGIRCYEKCGFRREGARLEARWWAGRWWSIFDYAILEQEWQALSPLRPSEPGFGGRAPRNAAT